MRSAIIGLGGIGRVHLQILLHRGETVVGLCDCDVFKAEQLQKETGLTCSVYRDYRQMLQQEAIDVVHICTPHFLHKEMIVAALKRNIHVLCEKPMAISLAEIEEILNAEKASSARLGVCHQNRWIPANLFVKRYLEDKRVVSANGCLFWHRDDAYYRASCWRDDKKKAGGGVLINQALHTMDLMQWWLKMPRSVSGTIGNAYRKASEVEDTAFARFQGEIPFTFFASNASEADDPVYTIIRTETELIQVFPQTVLINHHPVALPEDVSYFGKPCYGSGHEALIGAFYECVKENRPFPIGGEEAAKVVRMILGAYRSGGAWVDI